MTPTSRHYELKTSHGDIAVQESGQGDLAVLLIHGNSSCKEVFRHQFGSDLDQRYRLVAFDLPGHGKSSDSPDPELSYLRTGYADLVMELIGKLAIHHPVLMGWSLGGHIALDVAARLPTVKGVLMAGAPPIANHGFADGFIPAPHMKLASQRDMAPDDIKAFGTAMFAGDPPEFVLEAIRRTDGEARRIVFEGARAGVGADQRWLVENLPVPLAIVNGADDPFLKLDYLDDLEYRLLWEQRCHRIANAGHACFWQQPAAFNALAGRFLDDIRTGAAAG